MSTTKVKKSELRDSFRSAGKLDACVLKQLGS
jgi:hypothetical protein